MPLPNNNTHSTSPAHRVSPLRRTIAVALMLATATAQSHDWVSPSAERGSQGQPTPPSAAWGGLLWGGPQAGAPTAPGASDCRRPPQPFDVAGPIPPQPPRMPVGRMPRLTPREAVADSAAKARADVAAEAAAPAMAPAPAVAAAPMHIAPPQRSATLSQRPAGEPVTAGVVDDNADFGEYQAFRARHAQVPHRAIGIADRVRLDVQDAAGRPVPDAAVAVYAAGRAQPLWARTDAGGQVWLMPQQGMDARVFEVQVSKGAARARVLWQRGQKDALQVRLDGAALQPARLDLVFMIDATGSMADEIDKLRRTMQSVADQIATLPSRPDLCYGLIAYRDRGDAFYVRGADLTSDLGAFQGLLTELQAGGGGDYPEALNEALHTAVHRLSWRGEGTARLLLLVADAPPHLDHGRPISDEDVRGALARGIKMHTIGASGLDRQGEFIFRQAAQFTGGRFVFLTYDDARRPSSGPGRETVHDVQNYSVQTLDKLIVRLVREEMAGWPS